MSIYQKQIESERLNNEVEAWLLKNQITELPMGFSNFPDGRLPVAKGNYADKKQAELESLERIELVNQRVRELQARKEERWKQKEQARAEAKVQRELAKKERMKEQILVLSNFFKNAIHGDLNALCNLAMVSHKTIYNAKTGSTLIGKERWDAIKDVIANFKHGERNALAAEKKLKAPTRGRRAAPKKPSVETLRRSEVMSLSKQAIARGERIFTAPCAKHGYTSYRIYSGVARCLECKLRLNREYLDPKLDQVQLDRRERAIFNNERMEKALASGTNLFEGLCRVHGYTEFRAHRVASRNKNEFRCMSCSKASQKKFNQKRGVSA
ncbi:hypothetical protein [Acinetobacter towneri]|uniref:Uncharacterized protein n=1 Tax=Acinetobacter towneri TaxID=202956 RepID=A0ABX7TG43_9GAMM|nr:hypothetical protein [Acinetobacter towneri]QTD62682.1 hypothetical protein J4G45_05885 [Acinetobacter towneri]